MSKSLSTTSGQNIKILSNDTEKPLKEILRTNRNITDDSFFFPSLSDLHDPFLMPDMKIAVERILKAREQNERVVIFGDYDVDGVSSTALLYTFFDSIEIACSYRLPHRVKDGYGLKKYHFDELAKKNVKLVITVDCGTRDIEPIEYAKSLGIDVIVTDHHAVPEYIPTNVPILNPKRKDSKYPFPNLAGAGVALKLVQAMIKNLKDLSTENQDEILLSYIDLASLGTVADCMPLTGENRVITTLGLRQMKQSKSSALRKYIEYLDRDIEWDADLIGFQIGPRINAAWRMDSPLKALHWLIADESRVDAWLEEVENLNAKRQEAVKYFSEHALTQVNSQDPVLFYFHPELEHWLVGLIAGKLTEAYGKPSIVLCPNEKKWNEEVKREYENTIPLWVRNPTKQEEGVKKKYTYSPNSIEYAQENRKTMNEPEKIFWNQILQQEAFQNLHFHRQKPIWAYTADFFCSELNLVIEIDSEDPLDTESYDINRTRYFQSLWLQEVRFTDREIRENVEWIYEQLMTICEEQESPSIPSHDCRDELVASCRSPEWCNLVELLDECKNYFIRYGGHRQAAGFTIESSKYDSFQKAITEKFSEKYDTKNLPKKTFSIECCLKPEDISLETLDTIRAFRPFGIGNPKPLFLLSQVTIIESRTLGSDQLHLSLRIAENPEIKILLWNAAEKKSHLLVWNIVSLLVILEDHYWNKKNSVQAVIQAIVQEGHSESHSEISSL